MLRDICKYLSSYDLKNLSIKPRKTQSGVFLAEESSCDDVRSIFSIQVNKSMFNRRPEFPWIFFSMPLFINSPWVAFWRIFTCFSHAQKRVGIQITQGISFDLNQLLNCAEIFANMDAVLQFKMNVVIFTTIIFQGGRGENIVPPEIVMEYPIDL